LESYDCVGLPIVLRHDCSPGGQVMSQDLIHETVGEGLCEQSCNRGQLVCSCPLHVKTPCPAA
jgi:hypothetical protein